MGQHKETKKRGFQMKILIGVCVVGLLIFVHEFGHFITAKFFNVKVDEFAIGMGPKIFGFKKGETLYSVRLFPFGGYVKMEGEEDDSENQRAFCNKPVWQRFLIAFTGAFMNILLGFVLVLCLAISTDKLYDTVVASFSDDAVSNSCGLQVGDRVLKIGGYKLAIKRDLNHIMPEISKEPVDVVVKRNSNVVTLKNVKFPIFHDDQTRVDYPVIDFEFGVKEKTVFNVVSHAFHGVTSDIKTAWFSLKGIVTGKYTLNMMAGPVYIVKVMGNMLDYSGAIRSLVSFVVMITVNLGIFNLLPVPALDGGRILFLLIEAIRRKPMNRKWEEYINLIFFILLMAFGVFIIFNDIIRLISELKR